MKNAMYYIDKPEELIADARREANETISFIEIVESVKTAIEILQKNPDLVEFFDLVETEETANSEPNETMETMEIVSVSEEETNERYEEEKTMFVYEIWTYNYEDDIFDVATICYNRKDALRVHRDLNHYQKAKYFVKPIAYGQCHAAKWNGKIFGVNVVADLLQRRVCNKWIPEFAPEELPF